MNQFLAKALCLVSFSMSATLLAQVSTNPQVMGPHLRAKYSPDVLHYGTATGQTPAPRSRVQVFGFPMPGSTIELQVRGARPNVTATFYIATAPADQQIPGIGRLLVDLSGALSVQTTTDAQGSAAVLVTIPADGAPGQESFVQCMTVDSTSPSPQTELSTAAYFELGGAMKPIGAVSHLSGSITVGSQGASVLSTEVSGIHVLEWRPAGNGRIKGTVAIHTNTSSVTVNGQLIEELRVQPGANADEVTWQSSNFLVVPANTADGFLVSYTSQYIEYGPYVVPGTISSSLGDVVVQLGPLPSAAGGPLDGATIALDLVETFLGPEHFEELWQTGMEEGSNNGAAVTPAQVDERFATCAEWTSKLLARHAGDTGSFESAMPCYEQFVLDEAEILLAVTGNRASNATELHQLIASGQMTQSDGWGALVASKLLAGLGIKEGVNGFKEVFIEECGEQLEKLGKQIDNGEYKKAAKTCGKILDKVCSKGFGKKLANRIGTKLAGKILAKVGAKCIPLVGWAWFAASLLWAIIEQWFE